MPQGVSRLNAMAKVLADFAAEATEMDEHQLASLLIAAMTVAQRRSLDIVATLPELLSGQKQEGPPS